MRPLLFVALAACGPVLPGEPGDDPISVFEAAWTDMDEYYGNFDLRGIDWDAAWSEWSPQVTADSDDDALWAALTGMLATTDDGHVQMARPGEPHWFANTVYRDDVGDERFDLDVVREQYLRDAVEGDGFTYGALDGSTPYVHFDYVARNIGALHDVLHEYPEAEDLVVDLRHNSGGDFTWAYSKFGVLTDVARPVFRSRTRNGPERDDFTEWRTWSLEPKGRYRDVRVVLLTDRFTISAGERATMALQVLPGTITLGEPTNGALATMIGRELPNRWGLALPTQEVLLPDSDETWEGIGIPVDELILNDPADLAAGTDAVLDRALAVIAAD